jgi:hypothetical protein
MADKTTKLPDGYDDEQSFLSEARERFSSSEAYDRENRDAAIEDLEFLSGDQWDPNVKAARISQGRPCLTINQATAVRCTGRWRHPHQSPGDQGSPR